MLPVIRVFLSHKREDAAIAIQIDQRLKARGIETFLDVLDDAPFNANSLDLTDYLRTQLATCSHLLAVVSTTTPRSWWVPFESALQRNGMPSRPTPARNIELPDYLRKWPYLCT